MISTIILANVAAIFAYLAGAATDLSPLITRSGARAKLFGALTAIALCFLIITVHRNSN